MVRTPVSALAAGPAVVLIDVDGRGKPEAPELKAAAGVEFSP